MEQFFRRQLFDETFVFFDETPTVQFRENPETPNIEEGMAIIGAPSTPGE